MAMNQDQAVVGVFQDRAQAERAVEQLKSAGFRDDQIGFVVRDGGATGTDAADGGTTTEARPSGSAAAGGAVTGGILGGILGAAAALLIPGIGPIVAGGILAAALGGAAIGAAAGGIIGALTSMGVPEEEARYYNDEFQAGRTIVTVRANGQRQEAVDILRRNGAYDASTRQAGTAVGNTAAAYSTSATSTSPGATGTTERSQTVNTSNTGRWEDVSPQYQSYWQQRYGNQGGNWNQYEPVYRYGWEMRNNPQYQGRSWTEVEPQLRRDWETRYPNQPWDRTSTYLRDTWDGDFANQQPAGQGAQKVQLREETLQPVKQAQQAGEVQLNKVVREEQQQVPVNLKREEVTIERHAVDRPLGEGEIGDLQDETIRVPVYEEQAQLQKQGRVREEVTVNKEQVQNQQTMTGTTRYEDLEVQPSGDVNVQGDVNAGQSIQNRQDIQNQQDQP